MTADELLDAHDALWHPTEKYRNTYSVPIEEDTGEQEYVCVGYTTVPAKTEFIKTETDYIIEKYGYKCDICGKTETGVRKIEAPEGIDSVSGLAKKYSKPAIQDPNA